jgi:ribosomal protein L11
MAKKVRTVLTLQIPAGQANPAPPVGTALGPIAQASIHRIVLPVAAFVIAARSRYILQRQHMQAHAVSASVAR